METRIGKWGNSLALRIPRSVAAQGRRRNATVIEALPHGTVAEVLHEVNLLLAPPEAT